MDPTRVSNMIPVPPNLGSSTSRIEGSALYQHFSEFYGPFCGAKGNIENQGKR